MDDTRGSENARTPAILRGMSTTSAFGVLLAGVLAFVASTSGFGPVSAVEVDGAVVTATAARHTPADPIPGDCDSFRWLLALHAPAGGWDIDRMVGYADRESGCCPTVRLRDGSERTTRGGDRFSEDCVFSHVATWRHRSDAGLLQINGINYDPSRCDSQHCLSNLMDEPVTVDTLGDPAVNIRAAATLCELSRSWGKSCYRPWGG